MTPLGQIQAVGVREPVREIEDALRRYPKETFLALLRVLQLRHSAALYRDLGAELSLPRMKTAGSTAERVSEALVNWFPP